MSDFDPLFPFGPPGPATPANPTAPPAPTAAVPAAATAVAAPVPKGPRDLPWRPISTLRLKRHMKEEIEQQYNQRMAREGAREGTARAAEWKPLGGGWWLVKLKAMRGSGFVTAELAMSDDFREV